ncbi:ABC transporter permease [Streptomyces gardneri]|jgi:peptide/nickel transport system permease protein|uniref:ABC transporter permease n=1 Tax=Nocardia sp. NPDC047654 TaxID=3364314 RepID=UPI001893DE91|nr:ABC transporter permease [Streptomyces gardneri]
MLRFFGTRVVSVAPLLFLLTVVVFALVQIAPGDPAAIIAGPDASAEAVDRIRQDLGLDRPVLVQYLDYVANALQGDLGTSYSTGESVSDRVLTRLPRTASIAVLAILISVLLSIPMAVFAALKRNSWIDRMITSTSVVMLALPPFVLAALLIAWFSLGGLQILPPGGYAEMSEEGFTEWLRYAILPAIAISTISIAELARLGRGSLVDILEEDYIRTARAKGLSSWLVVGKHAAKNAAIPYVTILGLQVGRIVGAAVIVEAVFNVQGFGQLGVEAVLTRDLPTMQGVVLISGVFVIVTNLLVDISYGYFDPRTRTS